MPRSTTLSVKDLSMIIIERGLTTTSANSEYPETNPIRLHGLIHVQVEQQIPHKFKLAGSLPQSPPSKSGHVGSKSPSLVLKTEAKKALNITALSMPLFVR